MLETHAYNRYDKPTRVLSNFITYVPICFTWGYLLLFKKKTGLKKFHPDFVGNDAEDNKMTGYNNSATSSSPTPTPTHGPRIIPEKYEVLASSNYLKVRLRINCYTS